MVGNVAPGGEEKINQHLLPVEHLRLMMLLPLWKPYSLSTRVYV